MASMMSAFYINKLLVMGLYIGATRIYVYEYPSENISLGKFSKDILGSYNNFENFESI